MLTWAAEEQSGPVAIRYPRGGDRGYTDSAWEKGPVCVHSEGENAVLITYGVLTEQVMQAQKALQEKGISVTVLRLLSLSPLPIEELKAYLSPEKSVCVLEETMASCGIGDALAQSLHKYRVYQKNLGEQYVPHGDLQTLYRHCGLDADGIVKFVQEVCSLEG